jgi:hypothetical protein
MARVDRVTGREAGSFGRFAHGLLLLRPTGDSDDDDYGS